MKVLVTGANGQLGREAVSALRGAGTDVAGIDIAELDFSRPERVADGIAAYNADWVINCAAYTQVDRAEEDKALAFQVNRDSAGAVAQGVERSGGRLLHLSTDFIFDGRQSRPYTENDEANPLGVYGQSKWEGEEAIRSILPEAIILRTAWVYGVHGPNFVRTILRLAAERSELTIVDDQVGTPTWTLDIVHCMCALIEADARGLFHFTNEGVASWYDFATAIVATARRLGMSVQTADVLPIPTNQFPTAAERPGYSVLDKQKIRSVLSYPIPHWRESLEAMLAALNASNGL
jgi:dTDP-4-dehydrorhamnose reductase